MIARLIKVACLSAIALALQGDAGQRGPLRDERALTVPRDPPQPAEDELKASDLIFDDTNLFRDNKWAGLDLDIGKSGTR